MGWIIYDKTGEIERCTIKELEYNGSFMGERTVTCSFESPSVINFAIGDHITYRGEEFYLDYDPSQTKSASFGSALNAFKYDLIFRTIDIELQNCQLLDYVPYGNDYHYQPSPSFSFVGTAKTLAERIQANMNRDYPGWEIEVYDGVETEDAEIEIDNVSCWNALVMINKKFGLNFFISKRNVKIGYPEESLDHTFYYGKNNGLYQIERDVNADEVVVTRLYAYGGERNIPDDYNKRDSDFSGKKNLMLPGYLETGKNYIESKNISAYGIRECTMVFEDIYPSIAGVELPDIGRIDELVAAEQITKETETKGTFKITIKNIGFNIKDYLTTETATISMKSGSLIGYEFEIVDVVQLESGNYDITLNKSTRDDFQVPNAGQNLSAGDRFVILNIKMPEKYVEYAEDRLLKAATSCLAKHDHVFYTYNIGVDEIYMARNGNLHDLIREGMKLPLYDVDFGTDYSIIIQSLSIREGESIPTYDISLSDKPIASTIDKIWDAIDNVRNEGSTSTGGSIIGGGASPEELNKKYLRKDVNDTAKGSIHFEREIGSSIFIDGWEGKGWEIQSTGAAMLDSLRVRSDIYVGGNTGSPTFASGFTGWGWQIDTPTATGEMDNLFIRKTFTAYEIVYSQIYGLGGSQIVSDINKIARVEVMSDRYRCYMDDMDGLMLMNLRKGDGVRIQTRTGTTSIKYLFGRCIGVDSDYFDIAIPLIEGTGQPEAGDFALRWGNNEDTDRQGLIYLTTADSGAPFIDVYDGITDVSTEGKLKARIGHLTGIRTQRGDQLSGYGAYLNGIYVENSTFILQNGDTIEQTFIAMNGKFESTINSIRNDISAEGGNILVNSSFSQNTNYWTAANNVHFINVGGEYLWLDGSFYVEKDQVADIYNDNGQNVLRIRNTYILQQNAIMNIPDHTEEEEKTYSFSLFYKVLRPGSCGFGIPGTELYHEEQLPESDSYQKLSKVGKWNGKGDFELRFTGEILIYGVGLFSDEIADAIVKLQTQIDQTDEYIKLLATKDYVDSETGKIYTKYDTSLSLKADKAELTSFKEEYDEFQQVVRRDYATQSWTSSKIQTEVGSYVDGALVGYATTSWTSSQISSSVKDLASETYVDQTAKGLNININNLGDRVDSVEGELDSVTDITGAFYSFGSSKMRLNRRIEMGTGSNTSFQCVSGISPDTSGAAFWAGSTYENQLNAKIKLNHDGSGWLGCGNITWRTNGDTTITGTLQTQSEGKRVTISPANPNRFISFYNENKLVGKMGLLETDNNLAYLKLGVEETGFTMELSTAGLVWRPYYGSQTFDMSQYRGTVRLYGAWPTDLDSFEAKFTRGTIYVGSDNILRVKPE